ncbi:MAG: transporter [Burkholderiales bacterium]
MSPFRKTSGQKIIFALAAFGVSVFTLPAFAGCGASFCSVNTDWDIQGEWADSGGRFDLRYEYINLNQLRSGTSTISPLQIPGAEDEIKTRNQNAVATWDYNLSRSWGISFSMPFVKRNHAHAFNGTTGPVTEEWNFSKLGDARVLGRYNLPATGKQSGAQAGMTFGLKLPTGQINVSNDQGQLAERSLQPGSGTTDVVLGAYYRNTQFERNTSWFAQAQLQAPLNERDDFKPGRRLNLDMGYLRQVARNWGLMLQLNYSARNRDSGNKAEPDLSGGRSLSISPGASYLFGRDWQFYGFVQKPLYQDVNGVQLTSDWSAVLGLTTRF